MVYYFTSTALSDDDSGATAAEQTLYMGDDKEENEKLIRWGWPEDVWFHVDKLSSAHVYLRLQPDQGLDDIPQALIDDCCQLVKANSIEGCKLASADIVYTMWKNLKKTGDMVAGQVGFHDESTKAVKRVRIDKKKEIVNRLNKTKLHKSDVDFQVLREERDAKERQKIKEKQRLEKQQEQLERDRMEREKEMRSYSRVFDAEQNHTTNKVAFNDDDFF